MTQEDPNPARASVEVVGNEIVIRIQLPQRSEVQHTADRLVPLNRAGCRAEGLELAGLRAKVDAGELPVLDVGRRRYVRLADVLKLAKPAGRRRTDASDEHHLAQVASDYRRRRPTRAA